MKDFLVSGSRVTCAVIEVGSSSPHELPVDEGHSQPRSPQVAIHIPPGSSLHFKGKLRVVEVVVGRLECLGHEMAPHTDGDEPSIPKDRSAGTSVYSPKGHSYLGFRAQPVPDKRAKVDVEQLLAGRMNLNLVAEDGSSLGCLFIVAPNLETWTRVLSDHLVSYRHHVAEKMSLFGRDPALSVSALLKDESVDPIYLRAWEEAERLLDVCFLPDGSLGMENLLKKSLRLYRPNPDWETVVQSVKYTLQRKDCPKVMVVGGKGVGKSVLHRYLMNRLIREFGAVLFVDLDPGQSEFTVPGCLSCTKVDEPVLGPNFCHMDRKQLHCLFLGEVDMANHPSNYMRKVSALLKMVRKSATEEYQNMPWLINTMGFNHGVGLRFMTHILAECLPTTVVEILSQFKKKNFKMRFDQDGESALKYNLLRFEAMPESSEAKEMGTNDLWGIPEPRKLRDMATLSYFGHCQEDATGTLSETRAPAAPFLQAVPPYQVHFGDVRVQILSPQLMDVRHEDIPSLLCLSLVALSFCPGQQTDSNASPVELARIGVVPSHIKTVTKGFGLVRAIDVSKGLFFIVTPLSKDELESVNCLTLGSVFFPEGALISCGLKTEQDAPKKVGLKVKRSHRSVATAGPAAPYIDSVSKNPLQKPWQRYSKPRPTVVAPDGSVKPKNVP